MCPFVGWSKPRMSFTVVDFPEPLGPSNPNTSPRRTSKSTLSTARALGRPQKSLKILVKPRTETIVSPLADGELEAAMGSVAVIELHDFVHGDSDGSRRRPALYGHFCLKF